MEQPVLLLEWPLNDRKYTSNFYYKLLVLFWIVAQSELMLDGKLESALCIYFYYMVYTASRLVKDGSPVVERLCRLENFTLHNIYTVFRSLEQMFLVSDVADRIKNPSRLRYLIEFMVKRWHEQNVLQTSVVDIVSISRMFNEYEQRLHKFPRLLCGFERMHKYLDSIEFSEIEDNKTISN